MTSLQEQYAELISLTKQHLLDEFKGADRLFANAETYTYFRNYALSSQSKAPVPPKTSPLQPVAQQVAVPPKTAMPPPPPQPVVAPRPQVKRPALPQPQQHLPPPPPKQEAAQEKVGLFKLEPLQAPKEEHFVELKQLIREKLPQMQITDAIPDDAEARRRANGWQVQNETPDVILIYLEELPQEQNFLANIARAIAVYGHTISVVKIDSEEKRSAVIKAVLSDKTKLVLAGRDTMEASTTLKHYLRREGNQQQMMGNSPILLLPPLKAYFDEPALKATLWRAISQIVR